MNIKRLFKSLLVCVALMGVLPVSAAWKDIKADLVALTQEAEKTEGTALAFGVIVADDGTVTRVAADAAEANALIEGVWHDGQHGWTGAKMTVAVEGPVKIGFGNCQYGNNTVKVTDAAGTELLSGTVTAECWSSATPTEKVTYLYYSGEAATLILNGAGYTPYFSVEAINAADIPNEVTLTYSLGSVSAEGNVPEAVKVNIGTAVKVPANTTLYAAGKTLTGWTDGTATYTAGQEVTVNKDTELTPVFADNTVSLADRTSAVTIEWVFGPGNGAGVLNAQGKSCVYVTQATVNGSVIDVKMDVDATNGKLNNVGRGDQWAQVNKGTILIVPSCLDAVVSVSSYENLGADGKTATTIEGSANYTSATSVSHTVTGTGETVDIVFGDDARFLSKVSVTLPVAGGDEGEGDEDEPIVEEVIGDVTAEWNFKNDIPAGICEATNYQGKTAEVPSTVAGIVMTVDATNGKLYCVGRDNAQFNQGTILRVPVKSAKDTVAVYGYPGYFAYSVGGVEATEATTIHRATSAEAAQGYVEVVSTGGNSYLYGLKVVHVSMIQEKELYSTNFSDWKSAGAATKESTVAQKTKYSKENLTFSLYNTAVEPAGKNDKFNNGEALGWLQANKAADPYVMTSSLASVSRVRFVHAATGSNRGWKLEAKGDGDADWVVISETVADPAAWCEVNAEINRKNVQLRWTNLNSSQNAYMFELDIFGYVDMSKTPTLGKLTVNGEAIEAVDVFEEAADGTQVATIEISKTAKMISAENPLTDLVADNGEVTSVTYESTETSTVATIIVTANGDEMVYKATFVFKPDYTLTYYKADGSVLGTQIVEKDATIGTFAYGEADLTIAEGYKFRGWSVEAKEGKRKYTTDEVIVDNTALYAIVTDIEVASDDQRYFFQLNNPYFYAEDHEAFNLVGTGSYHDNQHGWTVNKGDKVELLVGKHAYIILTLCQYGNSSTITLADAQGNTIGTAKAPVSSDGQSAAFEYTGEAGVVTLSCDNGIYLHDVTIMNDANNSISQNAQGFYVVKPGDADNFLSTLYMANASASNDKRTYIFIPDGTYDLGTQALTKVSGNNISLIGQSMDNTIIVNCPEQEGIGVTATLLVTGSNTYFQDLTLKNAMDYYNSATAGRAVCLQDKGSRTICKNVKMLSYQDTYYSNANSQFYWETSEIHGCVDFICGSGDVFFNECLIVCESRKKNEKNGEVTITAPYTDASNKFGYVFDKCTIENKAAKFNWGRAWGGVPRLAWLNTTLNQPKEIATARFTAGGMNVAADKFVEYNSMDKNGNVVSPASNVVKFTKDSKTNEMETILTAEQAAEYSIDKVFTNWSPDELAAQVTMSAVKEDNNTLTWSAVDGAVAYVIFADGKLVDFTNETQYVLANAASKVEVRAANAMGGLSVAAVAGADKIADLIEGQEVLSIEFFSTSGVALQQLQQGINLIRKTYANGVVTTQKVVVK